MSNNMGRNAFCACGSGKKHKKCCLLQPVSKKEKISCFSMIAPAKREEIISNVLTKHFMPYFNWVVDRVDCDLSNIILEFLLDDITNWSPIKQYKKQLENNILVPWLLFSWFPDDTFIGGDEFDEDKTVAQNYLNFYEYRLSPEEKSFFHFMEQAFFSFYRVEKVEPDKVTVVDLLLGSMHVVICEEGDAEENFETNKILFASISIFAEKSFFLSMAPWVIFPIYQDVIFERKAHLILENNGVPLTPQALKDYCFEIAVRECFFDIMQDALQIQDRMLRNDDGDIRLDTKLFFGLDLPIESAFNQLLPLTGANDPEVFLKKAERNRLGEIIKIKFAWLGEPNKNEVKSDVVLGHITLEPGKLLLEADSEERLGKGHDRIEALLGEAVSLQYTKQRLPDFTFEDFNDAEDEPEWLNFPAEVAERKKIIRDSEKFWLERDKDLGRAEEERVSLDVSGKENVLRTVLRKISGVRSL